jgi:hypothetical protein
MTNLLIPMPDGTTVSIVGTFPMTEGSWAHLMRVLAAMKPGLVAESDAEDPAADESESTEESR